MNNNIARLLFSLTLLFGITEGQELPMQGPGRERMEQFKKIRMMEVLKLDEETSLRFFARYNKHQEAIKEIASKRDGLVDQLAALRKSDATDGEYEKVFKDLQSTEAQIAAERSRFLTELKGVITTRQIAEYVVFERNFNRQLMQLMREMAQERGRGRMGPPIR